MRHDLIGGCYLSRFRHLEKLEAMQTLLGSICSTCILAFISTGTSGQVEFKDLKPATYTFNILAKSIHGGYYEDERTIIFIGTVCYLSMSVGGVSFLSLP